MELALTRVVSRGLVQDARHGEFSHLAVDACVGFGRNFEESILAERELCELGVQIDTQDLAGLDTSSPLGWT